MVVTAGFLSPLIQREEFEPKAGGVQLGTREAYAGQLT